MTFNPNTDIDPAWVISTPEDWPVWTSGGDPGTLLLGPPSPIPRCGGGPATTVVPAWERKRQETCYGGNDSNGSTPPTPQPAAYASWEDLYGPNSYPSSLIVATDSTQQISAMFLPGPEMTGVVSSNNWVIAVNSPRGQFVVTIPMDEVQEIVTYNTTNVTGTFIPD